MFAKLRKLIEARKRLNKIERAIELEEFHLRAKIKSWPSDAGIRKCAQARLHTVLTLKKSLG